MATDQHSVGADELLRLSKDKQVSIRWPLAIDQRLDALMDRAHEAGERTNRRELLAALVRATDLSGEELGEVLRRYRRSTVVEAVLDTPVHDNVVSFVAHRPGPRASGSPR